MPELPAVALEAPPQGVRVYESSREVRYGDVDRHGRLRLDALAAYLQDVAGDDSADAGLRDTGGWVVRRSVFEVVRPATYGQRLELRTWASGAGSRWAERRLSVGTSDGVGARIEGVSLWVYVDPVGLRPVPLDAGFAAVYAPSTRGRRVSSRLQHPADPDDGAALDRRDWVLRATDIDPYGHVNNAATWAIVEELLAAHPLPAPFRAELEFRVPIPPDARVVVETTGSPAARSAWVRDPAAGTLFATARLAARAG